MRLRSRPVALSMLGLYLVCSMVVVGALVAGVGRADYASVLLAVGFAAVGAMVAVREPANSVGYLLLVAAAAMGLQAVTQLYVWVGHEGVALVALLSSCLWFVWLVSAGLLLPLVFPTGRLVSPRWRVVVGMALAALVLGVVGEVLQAGRIDVDSPRPLPNPLGVPGRLGDVVTGAALLGGLLSVAVFALGPVALAVRLRRSRGRERQQLKVFVFVAAAILVALLAIIVGPLLADRLDASWTTHLEDAGWFLGLLLIILGLPAAIGVAILRHQLYEIDVVINRTLVYGALTAALLTTYVASVLLLRFLLTPITGHNDLAVAVSTLAVAALFRPARARIQDLVDRRFYRHRYDERRTLDAFAERLRHELDLDAVGADLTSVANRAVQPAHISLWLRS